MTDPNAPANPDPAASPAAPAPQPAAPVTFTAEQVADRERAAAQRAHDAAMAEARRVFEGKQRPGSTATPATQDTQPVPSTVTGKVRAYERAIAAFDFPDEALALIDEEFDRVKPTDPRAWVEQRAAAFRVPKRGAATPTPTITAPTAATPSAPTAPQPAGHPVTASGAPPASTVVITPDTPIMSMSKSDQDSLLKQLGPAKFVDRMKREARERNVRVSLRG